MFNEVDNIRGGKNLHGDAENNRVGRIARVTALIYISKFHNTHSPGIIGTGKYISGKSFYGMDPERLTVKTNFA